MTELSPAEARLEAFEDMLWNGEGLEQLRIFVADLLGELAAAQAAIRLALEPYPPPADSNATEAWALEVQRRRQALEAIIR